MAGPSTLPSRGPAPRDSPSRPRPPLMPTNLNTPPTSPELAPAGTGAYRSFSAAHAQAKVSTPNELARSATATSQPRRLRNVKSQPLLGRANSNPTISRSAGAGKANKPKNTADAEHPRVIRKMSSLGLRAAALARDSGTGMSASSSVPDLSGEGVAAVAGRKRRRMPRRYTASAEGQAGALVLTTPLDKGKGVDRSDPAPAADVFTAAGKAKSTPAGVLSVGALADASSGEDADDVEEEEELAPLDPKIIFSKERFLSRHSQDFGHLYAMSAAAAVRASSQDKENAPVTETDAQRQARIIEEERIKGREKRRSWMLAKAGLLEDLAQSSSTGSASTPSTAAHRRRSSALTGSAVRSINSPDPSAPASDRRRLVRQSVDLRSQPILAGGPRPLSLVASQDLKRRLSIMGVDQTPRAAAPAQVNPSPICEELSEIEGLDSGSPWPAVDRMTRPHHARNPSSLSIPVVNRSRRASPAGSLPPPSAFVRQSDLLATSSAHSGHSTPTRGPLPPHLRNFSASSTTSSSLSSMGAIIGGSPGASSSSCSSGGDHLGGPAELAPEAFNFRMSVIDRPSSLRYSLDESDHVTHRLSSMSITAPGLIPIGSVRTDRHGHARASALVTEGSARDSVLMDDKAERVKRRRARAFLVAGLKLEQGASSRMPGFDILQDEDESADEHHDNAEKHGRRGGLVVDEPADLALLARLNEDVSDHTSYYGMPSATSVGPAAYLTDGLGASGPGGRKRYSVLRREKLGVQTQPLRGEPRAVARSQTPLLPLYLQPSRVGGAYTGVQDGSRHSHQYRASLERDCEQQSARPAYDGVTDFEHAHAEPAAPHSASSRDFPTLRRVGRLADDATQASTVRGRAGQPGITISLFESDNGSERQACAADDSASEASSAFSGGGLAQGLAPPADPSPDLSSEGSTGIWGRGMDSAELARQLFWQPAPEAETAQVGRTSIGSIHKVQSDIGIGGSYARQGATATTPITPSVVHADSAGASPGREQKESWSKGVRSWLTGSAKETQEGEMEKGFGDGRGGHVRKTPVQQYTTTPSTAPASQTLKEKKSWRPFLAGRRKRRGSLPEAFSMHQVNSMAPSGPAAGILTNGSNNLFAPSHVRSATGPATDNSVQLDCQATTTSPTLLSPPVFPPSSFTRANAMYSPLSAASFSPATPESLSTMTFPGMRVTETAQTSSPRILSPTSDYSPHIGHDEPQQSLRWRPHVTTTGLSLLDRSRTSQILSGKRSPINDLPTLGDPVPSGSGAATAMHGLGFNLPDHQWQGAHPGYKGKQRDDERHAERHAELPDDTNGILLGPMPPIHVSIRPPTGYDAEALETSGPRHLSPRSSLTRIASEPGSSLWRGDTLVSLNPQIRKALMCNANASSSAIGDYRAAAAVSDRGDGYGGITLANGRGEVLPAKLFFMLGFLLGPWVWLIGGWGLSPAGLFPSAAAGIHYSVLMPRKTSVPRHLRDPPAAISLNEAHLPVDKWVKRNRWAAVASSAVFIPAMCVGFAFVGTLI